MATDSPVNTFESRIGNVTFRGRALGLSAGFAVATLDEPEFDELHVHPAHRRRDWRRR